MTVKWKLGKFLYASISIHIYMHDIDAYIKPNSFHVQIYNPVLRIVDFVIGSLSNTWGV